MFTFRPTAAKLEPEIKAQPINYNSHLIVIYFDEDEDQVKSELYLHSVLPSEWISVNQDTISSD